MLLSFAVLLICASVSFAQTRIHNLPYTITSSDSYDIDTDLTSTGNGIIVQADNVTIDLKGHTIKGSGSGIGVNVGSSNAVEIRNGTITYFATGISTGEGTASTKVSDMRVIGNTGTAVIVDLGSIVENTLISGNGGSGINALGALIRNNSIYNNDGDGIYAQQSVILNNMVDSSGGYGIRTNYSTVKNNYVQSSSSGGFFLQGYSLVDGNTAFSNSSYNMSSCSTCSFGTNVAP